MEKVLVGVNVETVEPFLPSHIAYNGCSARNGVLELSPDRRIAFSFEKPRLADLCRICLASDSEKVVAEIVFDTAGEPCYSRAVVASLFCPL